MTIHTRHADEGSVSVLVAVLVPCLMVVFALIVDGADRLRALAHADAVATEAARAALTAVDTRGATIILDHTDAAHAAQAYLAATAHTGTIALERANTVHVLVSHTEPAAIGLLGGEHHVTGEASAVLGVGTSTGNPP